MIFLTVGNGTQPFTRLLSAIQDLAHNGAFGDEPITVQYGHSPCPTGAGISAVKFLSADAFLDALRECRIVVCHGGAGTLMQILLARKLPVVVPRLKRYGEIVDDHQLELARSLALQQRVVLVEDISELRSGLAKAASRGIQEYVERDASGFASLVKEALLEVVRAKHEA